MILTMEALTPLYGEAVARVLVEADVLSGYEITKPRLTSVAKATCNLRAAMSVLRDALEPMLRELPGGEHLRGVVEHLRRVSEHLHGLDVGETLPEHAVADRVYALRGAYERAAQQLATIEANVAEHLGSEWLKNGVVNAVSLLYSNFKEAKRAVETAKGCTDAVATTLRYQLAQANKRTARERYEAAGQALDLASIRERLAEAECQHEPVHKIVVEDLLEVTPNEGGMPDALYKAVRKACLRVAFYVAIGRAPEKKGA